MSVNTELSTHQSIMKEYYEVTGFGKRDEALTNSFEEILSRYQEGEIKDSKTFLQSLDSKALGVVQKYHSLADPINIDEVSPEGLDNLLKRMWEKSDSNGDGLVEVGIAKNIPMFPESASNEFKQAFVDGIKAAKEGGMSDKDLFGGIAIMVFRFNAPVMAQRLSEETGQDFHVKPFDFSYNGMKQVLENINENYAKYGGDEEFNKVINRFFDYFFEVAEESGYAESSSGDSSETESASEFSAEREAFFARLDQLGAAGYIAEMNKEKIEKLLEEKRKELEAQYGLNAKPPLEGEALSNAMKAVNEAMEEYRKQLLEQFKNKKEIEDKGSVTKNPTLEDMLMFENAEEVDV